MTSWTRPLRADIVVAGAGIVGLSVAWEGVRRGMSVVVVDRDARPVGASIRNFGHGCLTAQTGVAREYGLQARKRWLQLRDEAGLLVRECGTLVAARSDEELAVLREFVEAESGPTRTMTAAEIADVVPLAADVIGGAYLPDDIRVDPRTAVPRFAAYLAELGVQFRWSTSALHAEPGALHTSRGDVHASAVVLALGHDLDAALPDVTEQAGVTRCQLHMLRVAAPGGLTLDPALLSGTSLLRYDGFLACPSSPDLRARMEHDRPELLAAGVNLMMTQTPDGDLLIGDTHAYGDTPSPFAAEEFDCLLLDEATALLGVDRLEVRDRWLGVYVSAPSGLYLTAGPAPGVAAVTVTSGIGMTTALGLAPTVLDDLLTPR